MVYLRRQQFRPLDSVAGPESVDATFAGRFDPLNMVLYINGLSNNVQKPGRERPDPDWWDELKAILINELLTAGVMSA